MARRAPFSIGRPGLFAHYSPIKRNLFFMLLNVFGIASLLVLVNAVPTLMDYFVPMKPRPLPGPPHGNHKGHRGGGRWMENYDDNGDTDDPWAPPPPENNTVIQPLSPIPARVIYNRVPKCGSRTASKVMGTVCRRNHVGHKASALHAPYLFNEKQLMTFKTEVLAQQTPSVYNRHFAYVDMSALHIPGSVYVNLVRDPYDRLVSHFYFQTRSPYLDHLWPEHINAMTFDECVLQTEHSPCNLPMNLYMLTVFFCGQNPICRNISKSTEDEAVALAKHHIISSFAVVGLTEDMLGFFEVLEYILPAYFKGATREYVRSSRRLKKETSNARRGPASEESRALILGDLAADYDLYYFIRQRFYKQQSEIRRNKLPQPAQTSPHSTPQR